jgi:hypothetical protein
MKKLILINVAIHRFWNEGLVSSPYLNDTYVNLGYFLGDQDSIVVVDPAFSEEFLDFLKLHRDRKCEIVRVKAYARSQQWAAEIKKALSSPAGVKDFLFAGISKLEDELVRALAPEVDLGLKISDYKFLNRKSTLQNFAVDLGINMPPTDRGPYLIKPDLGQSGAGQISADVVPTELLSRAARLMNAGGNDPVWFIQKFVNVKHNLSLFGDKGVLIGAFHVHYNKSRSSIAHDPVAADDLQSSLKKAEEAFGLLAGHLGEKFKYGGPFGIDAIVADSGEVYPAIDLNVRWDKSRLIFEAAKHFSIPQMQIHSRVQKTDQPFREWWAERRKQFQLNEKGEGRGRYLYPYLITGTEVHYFHHGLDL